jgi:glycosyltransferase involved in cell wall biosynthesis
MKDLKPLVSIITVVYNCEQTIERTILNILKQDFENYEFIIVDGGSNDNTLNILKKYENQITKWVSEPDKGIYDAMNKGVMMANGEWINFMNAGDEFAICNFNSLFDTMQNQECDVIYGDVIIKKENDVFLLDQARPLQEMNYLLNFCHQSSFVRRKILINNPFSLKYKISSDYDFFLKIFIKNYKFSYVNEPISIFELGGISTGISKKYLKERLLIIYDSHETLYNKLFFAFKFLKTLIPINRIKIKKILN